MYAQNRDPLPTVQPGVQQTMAKRERSYFNNLADIKTIISSYSLELFKQLLVRKNQQNTVRETKRYAGHTDEVSGLNESTKFSNKGKIRSLGYNFNTRKLSNSSLFMEFRERCTV